MPLLTKVYHELTAGLIGATEEGIEVRLDAPKVTVEVRDINNVTWDSKFRPETYEEEVQAYIQDLQRDARHDETLYHQLGEPGTHEITISIPVNKYQERKPLK